MDENINEAVTETVAQEEPTPIDDKKMIADLLDLSQRQDNEIKALREALGKANEKTNHLFQALLNVMEALK